MKYPYAAIVALMFALTGCATSHTGVSVGTGEESFRTVTLEGSSELPQGELGFRLAALDVLQVDVFPNWGSDDERKAERSTEVRVEMSYRDTQYRITRGDLIELEIHQEPGKINEVSVLPNGNIQMPRLGREIRAVGLTPSELNAALVLEYGSMFKKPRFTVNVKKSGLEDLPKVSGLYSVDRDGVLVLPRLGSFRVLGKTSSQIAAMLSESASAEFNNRIEVNASFSPLSSKAADTRLAPDGQQYFHGPLKVSPSGRIFVPEAGEFLAAGKTTDEIRAELQQAFDRIYQNRVDVSVSLQESGNLTVFIGGEVKAPGKYPIQTAQTLMQLMSSAGWVTDTADINRVVLLHAVSENNYRLYQTNIAEVVKGKAVLRQDLKLSPRDIVIVPKSGIAELNIWIDQYIRRMLPIGVNVNYTTILNE
ncbi:polysaccharide biosynthesis/export family protein [Methyloversatilis sp.]|uniref:polysaccharide biosynthesis/export family protein n=1 Tax=Methyloversatilis sp. TaxID=2569862 RepID=UPI0035B33167